MATRSNNPIPARAIHPGEILREELRERGITQKEFAKKICVQPTHLNEFINGKRNLNNDLAIKLEKSLGISYKNWMNLHNGYIYDCKAIEQRNNSSIKIIKECKKSLNNIIDSSDFFAYGGNAQVNYIYNVKQKDAECSNDKGKFQFQIQLCNY